MGNGEALPRKEEKPIDDGEAVADAVKPRESGERARGAVINRPPDLFWGLFCEMH